MLACRSTVSRFQNRPSLGWRPVVGGILQSYTFMTFGEMDRYITSVSSSLKAIGVTPGSAVGIYASNSAEWMIAMKATDRLGAVCVPLYDTFGPEAVQFIIGHSEVRAVFCSASKLKELTAVVRQVSTQVLQIIVWGEPAAEVVDVRFSTHILFPRYSEMFSGYFDWQVHSSFVMCYRKT